MSVPKKLSVTALSQRSPLRLIEHTMPYSSSTAGASAIKCCYAAAGSGTGAEETELRALLSRKTSIRNHKGIVVAKKMSRKVSRRVVRPACIAGVRISLPNFRAPCGRTKL